MAVSGVGTPKRLYCQSNICVLCSFSFIQREITATGELVETKFLKKKLRLTEERIRKIKMVVESFEIDSAHDERNGVCLKCYGKVERVLHLQEGREKLKAELK
jgi:hypothetical protein